MLNHKIHWANEIQSCTKLNKVAIILNNWASQITEFNLREQRLSTAAWANKPRPLRSTPHILKSAWTTIHAFGTLQCLFVLHLSINWTLIKFTTQIGATQCKSKQPVFCSLYSIAHIFKTPVLMSIILGIHQCHFVLNTSTNFTYINCLIRCGAIWWNTATHFPLTHWCQTLLHASLLIKSLIHNVCCCFSGSCTCSVLRLSIHRCCRFYSATYPPFAKQLKQSLKAKSWSLTFAKWRLSMLYIWRT